VKDQYYNSHETWHSIDEVPRWFGNDVEYRTAARDLERPGDDARLFED
jgi:hypothetical protein